MKVQLIIRYVNGLKDTAIDTDSESTIVRNLPTSYIREQIRSMHPDLSNKRLKLLHNGRVLMSHTDFTKEISYLNKNIDDDNDDGTSTTAQPAASAEPIKIYFHCIVGDTLSDKELQDEEQMDQQPTKSTTEAPKGFDRLLSQGFSPADIEDLRRQFFRLHGSQLPSNADAAQIRELEDRWIDSSVNHEIDEFPANISLNMNNSGNSADGRGRSSTGDDEQEATTGNSNDTDGFGVREQMIRRDTQVHKEMLIGVCVGFALGGLALLLLFMDVGGVFGKRKRMAVICGVIVNLSFGVLKLMG